MAFNPLRKIIGDPNERALKQLQPIVDEVNELEPSIESLSDEDLAAQTVEFRERLEDGESLDDLLPEALAVCREAIRRTIGERAYDVQLTGAIALHRGMIAEMRTGEGKTLVATLALYADCYEVGIPNGECMRMQYFDGHFHGGRIHKRIDTAVGLDLFLMGNRNGLSFSPKVYASGGFTMAFGFIWRR